MRMLVECVPNFSEGRDADVIEQLAAAARSVPGAALLDLHADPDHHRSVLTLAGSPRAVSEAVFRAVAVAVSVIDLTRHEGVHPRLGAADVIPFVPLQGAGIPDCVELANELGERLAAELGLPIYYYAHAARSEQRERLPWIRQPQFEGLAAALASEERAPDAGPQAPHPTAGATVVGARDFLLAFNVDLETEDVKVARRIAKAIRESSGGMSGVQAKGLALREQGRVQVSMNLLDLRTAGPGRVFQEIRRLAGEAGVEVASSELVGLMPQVALAEASEALLAIDGGALGARVLETRIQQDLVDPTATPFPRYLDRLAGTEHDDPGGGSAAGLALAMGQACLSKALGLSRGGKGQLSDADLDTVEQGLPTRSDLLDLAREDHRAFASLMNAYRLPKADPERKATIRARRGPAVETPEQLIAAAVSLAESAARVACEGNPNLLNDAIAATELALAAARVARLNARSNQTKRTRQGYAEQLARLEAAAARARAKAEPRS